MNISKGYRFLITILIILFAIDIYAPYMCNSNYLGVVQSGLWLPKNIGSTIYDYQGKSDKKIYIVLDAHCNKGVQKNIREIIGRIKKHHKLSKLYVGVEGNVGRMHTRLLSKMPNDEIKDLILEGLLNRGLITGIELYSAYDEKGLEMYGVEDREIYDQDFKCLYKSLGYREEVEQINENIKLIIEKGKEKYYSQELKEIEQKEEKYKQGKLNFKDYLDDLIKISAYNNVETGHRPISYENLQKVLKVNKINKTIKHSMIKGEAKHLVKKISKKIEKEDNKELKETEKEDRYYETVKNIIKKYKIKIEGVCPNLNKYIKVQEIRESIDRMKLGRELEDLKYRVKREIAKGNKIQEDLIYCDKYLEIFNKYIKVKVVMEEAEDWQKEKQKFMKKISRISKELGVKDYYKEQAEIIKEAENNVSNFYDLAIKRNEIIVQNLGEMTSSVVGKEQTVSNVYRDARPGVSTTEVMQANDKRKTTSNLVLVIGGFHTQGITEILRSKGIGYTVILPNISNRSNINAKALYTKGILRQANQTGLFKIQPKQVEPRVLALQQIGEIQLLPTIMYVMERILFDIDIFLEEDVDKEAGKIISENLKSGKANLSDWIKFLGYTETIIESRAEKIKLVNNVNELKEKIEEYNISQEQEEEKRKQKREVINKALKSLFLFYAQQKEALTRNLEEVDNLEVDSSGLTIKTMKMMYNLYSVLIPTLKKGFYGLQLEKIRGEEEEQVEATGQYYPTEKTIAILTSLKKGSVLKERSVIMHELIHATQRLFREQLKKEWQEGMKNDKTFVSVYGMVTKWEEDMSEAAALYGIDPMKLKMIAPHRYTFLRDKIFNGIDLTNDIIKQFSKKGIEYAIKHDNMTLLNYHMDQLQKKEGLIDRELLERVIELFSSIDIKRDDRFYYCMTPYEIVVQKIGINVLKEKYNSDAAKHSQSFFNPYMPKKKKIIELILGLIKNDYESPKFAGYILKFGGDLRSELLKEYSQFLQSKVLLSLESEDSDYIQEILNKEIVYSEDYKRDVLTLAYHGINSIELFNELKSLTIKTNIHNISSLKKTLMKNIMYDTPTDKLEFMRKLIGNIEQNPDHELSRELQNKWEPIMKIDGTLIDTKNLMITWTNDLIKTMELFIKDPEKLRILSSRRYDFLNRFIFGEKAGDSIKDYIIKKNSEKDLDFAVQTNNVTLIGYYLSQEVEKMKPYTKEKGLILVKKLVEKYNAHFKELTIENIYDELVYFKLLEKHLGYKKLLEVYDLLMDTLEEQDKTRYQFIDPKVYTSKKIQKALEKAGKYLDSAILEQYYFSLYNFFGETYYDVYIKIILMKRISHLKNESKQNDDPEKFLRDKLGSMKMRYRDEEITILDFLFQTKTYKAIEDLMVYLKLHYIENRKEIEAIMNMPFLENYSIKDKTIFYKRLIVGIQDSLGSDQALRLQDEYKEQIQKDNTYLHKYASLYDWETDMVLAVELYVTDPLKLRLLAPLRYKFLKDKIFGGKEFDEELIQTYAANGLELAITNDNITSIFYHMSRKAKLEEVLGYNAELMRSIMEACKNNFRRNEQLNFFNPILYKRLLTEYIDKKDDQDKVLEERKIDKMELTVNHGMLSFDLGLDAEEYKEKFHEAFDPKKSDEQSLELMLYLLSHEEEDMAKLNGQKLLSNILYFGGRNRISLLKKYMQEIKDFLMQPLIYGNKSLNVLEHALAKEDYELLEIVLPLTRLHYAKDSELIYKILIRLRASNQLISENLKNRLMDAVTTAMKNSNTKKKGLTFVEEWQELVEKEEYFTDRTDSSLEQDIKDSVYEYIQNPKTFKVAAPYRYSFLMENFFKGTGIIIEDLHDVKEACNYVLNSKEYNTSEAKLDFITNLIDNLDSELVPKIQVQWEASMKKDGRILDAENLSVGWTRDFSDAVDMYLEDPEKLRILAGNRFEFLEQFIFYEGAGDVVGKNIIKEDFQEGIDFAIANNNITLLKYHIQEEIRKGYTREKGIEMVRFIVDKYNDHFAEPDIEEIFDTIIYTKLFKEVFSDQEIKAIYKLLTDDLDEDEENEYELIDPNILDFDKNKKITKEMLKYVDVSNRNNYLKTLANFFSRDIYIELHLRGELLAYFNYLVSNNQQAANPREALRNNLKTYKSNYNDEELTALKLLLKVRDYKAVAHMLPYLEIHYKEQKEEIKAITKIPSMLNYTLKEKIAFYKQLVISMQSSEGEDAGEDFEEDYEDKMDEDGVYFNEEEDEIHWIDDMLYALKYYISNELWLKEKSPARYKFLRKHIFKEEALTIENILAQLPKNYLDASRYIFSLIPSLGVASLKNYSNLAEKYLKEKKDVPIQSIQAFQSIGNAL